jgi:hypothetical protein
MKDCQGEELIALSSVISIKIAECMDLEELTCFSEFLGLLKHHLDIIRVRRFLKKVEKKVEAKKEEQK